MNFMKYRYFYFAFSLCFLIPGIISLILFRLKPSIDFTGGSLLELKVEKAAELNSLSKEKFEEISAHTYEVSSVQRSGEDQFIVRGKPLNNEQKETVIQKLQPHLGRVTQVRFESVGPVLGKELIEKTLIAVGLVSTIITLYVWRQFKSLKYGASAILAMFHDSLILLGSFSILGHFKGVEVDVLFVTALLTTLSFSVHDTIVVFDRIREMLRKNPRFSYFDVVNAAVLETLGRSINNSVTIIIMLLTLVFLGGETIRWFAVALLIGSITGTYSSTFCAVPLLILWDEVAAKIKQRRK